MIFSTLRGNRLYDSAGVLRKLGGKEELPQTVGIRRFVPNKEKVQIFFSKNKLETWMNRRMYGDPVHNIFLLEYCED